jgi:hypothetical protein
LIHSWLVWSSVLNGKKLSDRFLVLQFTLRVACPVNGELYSPSTPSIARIVQDHGSNDRSEQIVDDLGSILTHVDGVEPKFLIHLFLDRKHPLNPTRLDRL